MNARNQLSDEEYGRQLGDRLRRVVPDSAAPIAASGLVRRARRLRRRRRIAGLVVGVAVIVGVASSAYGIADPGWQLPSPAGPVVGVPGGSAAGGVAGGAGHVPTSPPRPPSSEPSVSAPVCRIAAPKRLTSALDQGWAKPWPEIADPFDASSMPASMASSGAPVVADVQSGPEPGVALVRPDTGAIVRMIEPHASGVQAVGAFDGVHAVWTEVSNGVATSAVKEWNAKAGTITTIGQLHDGPDGKPLPSNNGGQVLIADGRAAWVEYLGNNGSAEIVVVDLQTGQRSIVDRGYDSWLALTGSQLVWRQATGPGSDTSAIRALDLTSGKQIAPPRGMASVSGVTNFATDGTDWVWTAAYGRILYESASYSAPAVRIGSVPQGGASDPYAIAQGIATVPVSAGGLVFIDVKARTWTYVSTASFAAAQGPDRLLVMRMVTDKASTARAVAPVTSAQAAMHPSTGNSCGSK